MSLLETDGYKFSMAEAGWPLRDETFYYTHRRGGPALLPFDVKEQLRRLFPTPTADDYAYLAAHEYEMGAGFKAAITKPLGGHARCTVHALPKGSWFLPREPVFSISGPSALISWLEPLVLQLHYRIQVATLARTDLRALALEVATVTCPAQRDIVLETLDAVGITPPPIAVNSEAYVERTVAAANVLVDIVKDPARIFEVGLRAATCTAQHLLALEACGAAGIRRTSNVLGAQRFGMLPVGTMGHEHVQRYGSDDAAFRAMRDRRPARSSYLLDTFDTIHSGIPAAFRLMEEDRRRGDSIRYDSGDKVAQYRFAATEAKRRGLRPIQILEDSFDAPQTRRFEELRAEVGWAPEEQFYGYGGVLVAQTSGTSLTRDKVAAVYKLSRSGVSPTMKFADEAGGGKESVPGRPIVFRHADRNAKDTPIGIIGQEGERPPPGFVQLTDGDVAPDSHGNGNVVLSDWTRTLVAELRGRREAMCRGN